MQIKKIRLPEIDKQSVIQLCNDPLVRKHMPLAEGNFGEREYAEFISAKEKIWAECGYGPWAYVIDDNFIGWGGLQPEGNDVEIALVLNPKYWVLQKKLKSRFRVNVSSVIVFMPQKAHDSFY